MSHYLLAIDQGTTSTRTVLFELTQGQIASAQRPLTPFYPDNGWVEQDALQIRDDTLALCREMLAAVPPGAPVSIGLSNQRETTVLWHRATGQPIHRAIVWQDRRTAEACAALATPEREAWVTARTGLLLDPYFSATKIAWLLDHVPGARAQAERGELAFGTVDSWLIWHLTGGAVHATDATNASRTLLFNLHTLDWDDELLALFNIPRPLLPAIKDCADDFGHTDATQLGRALPIRGVAGDQQAATLGQGCLQPGMVKSTYGTGCFLVMNTGAAVVPSRHRLLSTLAWRLQGQPTYAQEGSIFVAGAAVQWLRDTLKLIAHAADSEVLARATPSTRGVYLVPAFTGLGAPYWDPQARGAIVGLSRDSGVGEIVRACLEAMAYQTRDILEAMRADGTAPPASLRVDGGMAQNDWLMQFLADLLNTPVERPGQVETTVLGAARLAGLGAGLFSDVRDFNPAGSAVQRFEPAMSADQRETLYAGWLSAVGRVRSTHPVYC